MKTFRFLLVTFLLLSGIVCSVCALPGIVQKSVKGLPVNPMNPAAVSTSSIPQAKVQALDPTKFSISKSGIIFPDSALARLACAQVPNGKIMVVWEKKTPENKYIGEATFFSDNMNFISSTYFSFPSNNYQIGDTVVIGLENNTFLIAYTDIFAHNAKYVILNDNGSPLFEPRMFCDGRVDSITLSHLPGKKTILLSYQKYSDISAKGEYQVLDLNGSKIMGPVVFNDKGLGVGMKPLVDGGLIDYYFGCGFSRSKTIDIFGNVVRRDTTFWHEANKAYQPIRLSNGNTLVLCVDEDYKPMSYFIDPQGNRLGTPLRFISQDLMDLSGIKLASGNIFLFLFGTGGLNSQCYFTEINESGSLIKEIKPIDDNFKTTQDMTAYTILNNGKALIIYSTLIRDQNGAIAQRQTGYKIVTL